MASETVKSAKDKAVSDVAATPKANARPRSTEIFERGKKTLVGGVDSPVRAFRAVGGTPRVVDQPRGSGRLDGALRKLGNGSGDVRGAARARFHRARPGDQVRGLLPRTFRRISFGSRLGACDAGNCRVSGSAGSF